VAAVQGLIVDEFQEIESGKENDRPQIAASRPPSLTRSGRPLPSEHITMGRLLVTRGKSNAASVPEFAAHRLGYHHRSLEIGLELRSCENSGSQVTPRWREMDSNFRFRAR
jgi:hypothetical protein